MIPKDDLRKISKARLKDAIILYKNGRLDGAVYLCGYAIEIALKVRICKTLKWPGFPSTKKEFEDFKSFKTHKLQTLLTLSGIEHKIKPTYLTDWSIVGKWDPETRYSAVGTITQKDAHDMIESTKVLLKII